MTHVENCVGFVYLCNYLEYGVRNSCMYTKIDTCYQVASKVFTRFKVVRYNVVPYNYNVTKVMRIYTIANGIHQDKYGKLQLIRLI